MAGLPDVYRLTYGTNLTLALQQFGSKLENTVMVENGVTGEKFKFETRIDAKDAVQNTASFRDVLTGQPDIVSRWVGFDRAVYEAGVENLEKMQAGIDPTGKYVENGAAAIGRFVDDKIIAAGFGNALTGKDGATNTALPAGSIIAAGGTGWTRAKMDEIQEKLDAAEIDMDREMVTAVISPKAHTDLRNIDAYVNWDFTSGRPLEGHAIKPFMGIHRFIVSNRLPENTGIRDCLIYTSKGIGLAKWGSGLQSDVRELPQKTGKPLLVEAILPTNATRLDESRVLKVQIAE